MHTKKRRYLVVFNSCTLLWVNHKTVMLLDSTLWLSNSVVLDQDQNHTHWGA
jgi:hypothetical protein